MLINTTDKLGTSFMINRKKILMVTLPFEQNFISVALRQEHIINFFLANYEVSFIKYDSVSCKNRLTPFGKLTFRFKSLILNLFKLNEFEDVNAYLLLRDISHMIETLKPQSVVFLCKPFFFIKLAYRVKKLYPELFVAIDLSDPCYTGKSRFVLKDLYVKFFERQYLSNTDVLVVLNNQVKNYYKSFVKRIYVIEQGISVFKPTEDICRTVNINRNCSSINIVYGGKFHNGLRDPNIFIKAINESKIDFRLHLYTNWHTSFFGVIDESRIYVNDFVSQEELFNLYSACDVILHFDNFYGNQVPGKTLELLQFNKPIILIYHNENSDTLKYYEEYEGIVLARNNITEVQLALTKVLSLRGEKINRDVSKYYFSNIIMKYNSIFHV